MHSHCAELLYYSGGETVGSFYESNHLPPWKLALGDSLYLHHFSFHASSEISLQSELLCNFWNTEGAYLKSVWMFSDTIVSQKPVLIKQQPTTPGWSSLCCRIHVYKVLCAMGNNGWGIFSLSLLPVGGKEKPNQKSTAHSRTMREMEQLKKNHCRYSSLQSL